MKKILILLFLVVSLIFLILIYLYVNNKTPYYITEYAGEYTTENLLTLFHVQMINKSFDEYEDQNAWLGSYMKEENVFSNTLKNRLKKYKSMKVSADIEYDGYGSLVLTYVGEKESKRCMQLPYEKLSDERVLFNGFKGVTQFAGNIVGRCNSLGEGLKTLKTVSFYDYIYSRLLSCIGKCNVHGGVIFRSIMSDKEKNLIEPLIYKDFKKRYLQGLDVADTVSPSFRVEVFFKAKEGRYLIVRYKDNFYGEFRARYLVRESEEGFIIVQDDAHSQLFFLFDVPLS